MAVDMSCGAARAAELSIEAERFHCPELLAQRSAVRLPDFDQLAKVAEIADVRHFREEHVLIVDQVDDDRDERTGARLEASITLAVHAAIPAVACLRAPAPIDVRVLVSEVERERSHVPLTQRAARSG